MRLTIILSIAFVLAGCAFSGIYLDPPTERSLSSNVEVDIRDCMIEASEERTLTSDELAILEGKETARLFMNGRPVITPDGKPALHQSLFPQPASASADRYALCLLQKGYRWVEN